ncbi:murein hydrolase activator EnvC family protein [Gaiella sp.]|uniref:murein hydrolase activator EnvC family protein n=1 Tax=Gaiella sp. TaxID=2663207 RepID=UPI002C7F7AA7|nr:peptidoglycan DD-metalloendopeptidase family protein [Gaiella sp.]HWO79251.1 peptidoglycan DD-metalloendopeptidase family protein [Gaiella sp.]
MGRRAGLGPAAAGVLILCLLLVAGTAAGDPGTDKARIDGRIDTLRGRAAAADQKAGVLTEQLSAVAGQVRELEAGVRAQQARLSVLRGQLAGARARLAALDGTIARQTERLGRLRGEYRLALIRLEQRVRELYMTDGPDALAFVLGTASFADLIDNLDLLNRIGRQDERIAARVKASRDGVADARRRTKAARVEAAHVEAAVASATSEQQDVVSRLVASRDALVAARRDKSATLASIRDDRASTLAEIDALEEQSAVLAERIRQAQQQSSSVPVVVPSGSGVLGWPVSGPVTSGFGLRWGRMHEGIDIAVAEGTPVRAAGAGTVIYAGWMGGYGNLVVVDHGNGLSTAYAHNSSLGVGVGQSVTAGQVVSYSGNTGNSTGPHVHFEVRVNGSAVDPLGYL